MNDNKPENREKTRGIKDWTRYFTVVKVVAWFGLLYASTFVNLHALFVIVTGIVLIFRNLGKRKPGDVSAYSVFNKNFQKPAGSMDADEMLFGKSKGGDRQRLFG